MGESTRAVLWVIVILSTIAALILWFGYDIPDNSVVWSFRIVLPLVIAGLSFVLIRGGSKTDLAPDFLQAFFGTYFERDGMCFWVLQGVEGNSFVLHVVYQNHYDRRANLQVKIGPPVRMVRFLPKLFDGITLNVSCVGGGVGIVTGRMDVPIKHQGKKHQLKFAAATEYPEGRGRLLRFRNGRRVTKANSRGLGSEALQLVAALVGGVFLGGVSAISAVVPVLGGRDMGRDDGAGGEQLSATYRPAQSPPMLGKREQPSDESTPSTVRNEILWLPGDPEERVMARLESILAEGQS